MGQDLPRPCQLPVDLPNFTGRREQIEMLRRALNVPGTRAPITAIEGTSGIGKTALAVHVGYLLAERYPDGQLFLDLAGSSTAPMAPAQALTKLIRSLTATEQLPGELSELVPVYLDLLRDRRILIVLDDARDGDQVAPLIPPPTCGMIITSRAKIVIGRPVDRISLELMSLEDAVSMLGAIIGRDRSRNIELGHLANRLMFHPLALGIAGAFLASNRNWTVESYLAAFEDEERRFESAEIADAAVDLTAALSLSVRELSRQDPLLADHWRELSAFAGDFDLAGAAAVWDLSPELARDVMKSLVARSMVHYDVASERYRLHDLMRGLASGRAAPAVAIDMPKDLATRLDDAGRRHAEHYRGVLAAANDGFLRGGASMSMALSLFDRDRLNIEAGQGWAAAHATTDRQAAALCIAYPNAGAYVLSLRQLARERVRWLEAAVRAAREIGDRRGEGAALGNLGNAYAELGEARHAIKYYVQRLSIAREVGDRRGEGAALGNLGNAYAELGETSRAIEYHVQDLIIAREIGDRRGEGTALGNLGNAYADLGETRRAIEHFEQRLTIAREIGDRRGEGATLGNLGLAYADLGEMRRAVEYHEKRLMIAREIGDRRGEGNALGNLGIAYRNLGETRRAIEHFEQQLTIAREIGDRRGEGNGLGNLGLACATVGETRRAIEHFEQQLTIAREIGDRGSEGAVLANLGLAYSVLGETRRAIQYYEQALVIFIAIEDRSAERVKQLLSDAKSRR